MTRRRQMNTFNNKLFDILSELTELVVSNTVLEEPENRKSNSWYLGHINNILSDQYWRDPHYERLSECLSKITAEKISECIRLHLRNHDFIAGLQFFAKLCGCSEDTITEFGILYQVPIMESDNTNTELLQEIAELKKVISEKDAEIARLNALLNQNKIAFTKDNITAESIRNAKVVLRKGNRNESYPNLDALLEEEEITLSKPYEEIARMLKSQSGDKFRYFQQSAKTRIDFYF